jgi:hypothetical protein
MLQDSGRDIAAIEELNTQRFFAHALLTIIQQNDPVLHRRITQWQQEVVADFEETIDLWGKDAAYSDLYRKLTNPVLPDRRKQGGAKSDDSKLLHEYQLIVDRLRSLQRGRRATRRVTIPQILRTNFPEVDSPDFAPGGSASETAYRILAARYTHHNIDSLITRLKRARNRIKRQTYQSLQTAIHLLKAAQRQSKDPELRRHCELAIEQLKAGYRKAYQGEMASPFPPPNLV